MKHRLKISAEQEDPCLDYPALGLDHLELNTDIFFKSDTEIPPLGTEIFTRPSLRSDFKFVGKGTHYIGNEKHIGINSDGIVIGIICE